MSETAKTLKKDYPLTIAPELFETWQRLKRKRDPKVIAETVGLSRPIIDRALVHGHVTAEGLVDKINKFFEDRLDEERKTAKRLNAKQAEAAQRLNK